MVIEYIEKCPFISIQDTQLRLDVNIEFTLCFARVDVDFIESIAHLLST